MSIFGTKVTVLGKDWQVIRTLRFETVPRRGEFIYIEGDKYYCVHSVIHNYPAWFKNKTCVVVDPVNEGMPK